jgi:hypothetical protein
MEKLIKEIEKTKQKLIEKAKKNGLYENFGQNEVRKLEDKHINSSDYTREMNEKRLIVSRFSVWCMNYTI